MQININNKEGNNYTKSNKDDVKQFDILNCTNYEKKDIFFFSSYIKPNLGLNYNNQNSQINNCNSNHFFKNEQNALIDIVYLLKNNLNINSYIHLLDRLNYEDFSKMFSFILNNVDIFISNSQSIALINKIINLFNQKNFNDNKENTNNINENIYSFLFSFFNKNILSLIQSNNYIYSVNNLVIKLGFPKNDFIYNELVNDFKTFALNRQGCILIQNLFPLGNEIQKINFLNKIIEHCNELIVDKYGHYLFKYLLYKEANQEKYYFQIFNKIINDVKKYTNNKYSSVVIERLLDSSNPFIKDKIIEKICLNENDIIDLLYHAYGNYVLQKIIKVTKDNNILEMIYKTIMKNKTSLNKLSYGKKILKEISSAYTLK